MRSGGALAKGWPPAMIFKPDRRANWLAGLVAMALLATTALAQEPSKKPKPPESKSAEVRDAQRDLSKANARRNSARAKASTSDIDFQDLLDQLGRPKRTVQPTSLTPSELDALIQANLTKQKVAPVDLVEDEPFVRRLYLDVTGQLPSPEQVLEFAQSDDPEKRTRLIDELLESPEYARNWARYWRDVVTYRATFNQNRLTHYEVFESWLADQLAHNRPWDEIVRAMLTAEGDNEKNGALGFLAAHQAQPVELAGEASRIFLGVQIACAQCHDHLTDPWKREQFHEFAAFFAGTRAIRNREPGSKQVTGLIFEPRRGQVRYTMPDLKDPQKSIPIEPKYFLAKSGAKIPPRLPVELRRELAASYMTGQDNPWFAKAFVNRVWYALIGEAFYDPIDDLGPSQEPIMPEVLDQLASQWASGGYDIRWLFRTILNTETYQRQGRSIETEAGRTPFAAGCPSRLRSDQILDALDQALGLDAANRPAARNGKNRPNPMVQKQRQLNARRAFNNLFGVDPSVSNEEILGTIPQSLFLMNSPQVNRAIQANRRSVLGQLLDENPENPEAIEALYLRVLARRPTAEEVQTCRDYLGQVGDRDEGFEDILWALINSAEFISRR